MNNPDMNQPKTKAQKLKDLGVEKVSMANFVDDTARFFAADCPPLYGTSGAGGDRGLEVRVIRCDGRIGRTIRPHKHYPTSASAQKTSRSARPRCGRFQ